MELDERQMMARLRWLCAETSQADEAKRLGISRQYINDLVRDRRPMTAQLARAMGYVMVTTYRPIGEVAE